jgi:hypothetical protein
VNSFDLSQLRAIADHIERNNLNALTVYASRSDMPIITVYDETELRAWCGTLAGPAMRIMAHAYNTDHVYVKADGTIGGMRVCVHYPCNAGREFDLYAALAWQVGDSDVPVEVTLPAADTEMAVAS